MQQVLVRSPHGASKLAALADIALGSDAPSTVDLVTEKSIHIDKTPIHETESIEGANKFSEIAIPTNEMDEIDHKRGEDVTTPISEQVTPKKKTSGNKLGFKAKKSIKNEGKVSEKKNNKKGGKKTSGGGSRASTSNMSKKAIDVYEFEDSKDSTDEPIMPLSKAKPVFRAKLITKEMVELNAGGITPNSKSPMNDESQLSSTSFSDRDDFTFGVNSGGGTESESEVVSDEDPSSSKLPDVNNVQTKCLIMGRIFKNAKKAPSTTPDIVLPPDSKSVEKVQKLPKQELDKLFDSLKKVEETNDDQCENDISVDADRLEKEIKRNDRKSKKSREIQSLEAEWGMSLEQIKEIIGVGQRKSQRKCAVGKQKILAETWSSDEYEDFHSTKDIIALIQETEIKAVQRRNRSRSAKKNEDDEEKRDASAYNNKDDNAETSKNITKGDDEVDPSASVSKENVVSNSLKESKVKRTEEKLSEKVSGSKPEDKIVVTDKSKVDVKDIPKEEPKKAAKINLAQRRKSTAVKPASKLYYDSESDFEADWNRRSKIKKRRKTIAFKEVNTKPVTKQNLPSLAPLLPAPEPKSPSPQPTKLSKSVDKQTDIDQKKSQKKVKTSKIGTEQNQKSSKKEDKNTSGGGKSESTGKPMSRRKRIASEMLYYWSSSSSDDEFGRVDESQNDEEAEEDVTPEGERLQQHGWIVGDSHKKLVTLLAHAKGKMADDCGVKEAGNKKKS